MCEIATMEMCKTTYKRKCLTRRCNRTTRLEGTRQSRGGKDVFFLLEESQVQDNGQVELESGPEVAKLSEKGVRREGGATYMMELIVLENVWGVLFAVGT
jgi:hypothetical protein